jgi:hypothetical protein
MENHQDGSSYDSVDALDHDPELLGVRPNKARGVTSLLAVNCLIHSSPGSDAEGTLRNLGGVRGEDIGSGVV